MRNKNKSIELNFTNILLIAGTNEQMHQLNKEAVVIRDGEKILSPDYQPELIKLVQGTKDNIYYKWLTVLIMHYFGGKEGVENYYSKLVPDPEIKEDIEAYNQVKNDWGKYLAAHTLPSTGMCRPYKIRLTSPDLQQTVQQFDLPSFEDTGFTSLYISAHFKGMVVIHGIVLPDGRILEFIYQDKKITKRFLVTSFDDGTFTKVQLIAD